MPQPGQAPDVLVEMSPHEVGNNVTQHAGDEPQQQCFTQRQRTAAGQYRHGKQQYRARHDQPGNCQAFHEGHDENRSGQPLRVGRQPSGYAIEPWAHKDNSQLIDCVYSKK
ncbi:hypothetical protein D3C84_794930 [compost metagenome]